MTDRTTITIRDDVFERLAADRGDNESWSGYLERLYADAHDETASRKSECTPNALTEDHIDDIAQRTATEVENRMTRR